MIIIFFFLLYTVSGLNGNIYLSNFPPLYPSFTSDIFKDHNIEKNRRRF